MPQYNASKPNVEQILAFFEQTALCVGTLQLTMQPSAVIGSKGLQEFGVVKDAITHTEFICQELILRRAMEMGLNQYGLIAEEKSESVGSFSSSGDYKLVIDALDGTYNYGNKRDEFGVSLGLMRGDEFIVGIIYVPKKKALFGAVKGKGAYQLDIVSEKRKPIRLTAQELKSVHLGSKVSEEIEKALNKNGIKTERPKCAVFSIYSILTGDNQDHVNGFFNKESNIWDIGPGALILQEAGGYFQIPTNDNKWSSGRNLIPYCLMFDSHDNAKAFRWYTAKWNPE